MTTKIITGESLEITSSPSYYTASASTLAGHLSGIDDAIPIVASVESKTDDYSVSTSDSKKLIVLGAATAADKTFTLPSVGEADDGLVVHVLNDSEYRLRVATSDSDRVWNSGPGYGIDMPDTGTMVTLRYRHSVTKWDVMHKTGGKVLIQGLVLAVPMEPSFGVHSEDTGTADKPVVDGTGRYRVMGKNNLSTVVFSDALAKFRPGAWNFPGSDEYAYVYGDSDFDIFGDQTGHKTVACWCRFDATGSDESLIVQYEDANNRWAVRGLSSNSFQIYMASGGTAQMNIQGGTKTASAWTHVAAVISGSDVGLYVNGVQVGYDGSWSADSFVGYVCIGQDGNASGFFDGCMQDLHISYNNPYGASPVSGNTDSFSVPTAPFQGVMP